MPSQLFPAAPLSNLMKGNTWLTLLCSLITTRKKRQSASTFWVHVREAQEVSVSVEADVAAISLDKKHNFIFSLILISLFLISSVSIIHAENYPVAQTYLHSFNNGITVYSGVFALNTDISLDTSTYFKYTVDLINPSFGDGGVGGAGGESGKILPDGLKKVAAISGASTASSSGGGSGFSVQDARNELTAGVTHNFNNIVGTEIYYDYSKERDYTSNTPTITLKKDLFEKNTTLTAAYSRSMDQVYGKFMDKTENRDSDNYFLGVTQVISPFTVARAGYSRSKVNGFTSEGVRLVPVDGATQASCTDKSVTCVDEAFPDSRSKDVYLFGINHYFKDGFVYLLDRSAIRFTFRYYTDDWNINSHTEDLEYYIYISDQDILRLNFRYYDQSKAYFVKTSYTSSDLYKSTSPQLESFNSQLIGIKLSHQLEDIPGGYVEGKYEYYTESINVNANVFMFGVKFTF